MKGNKWDDIHSPFLTDRHATEKHISLRDVRWYYKYGSGHEGGVVLLPGFAKPFVKCIPGDTL